MLKTYDLASRALREDGETVLGLQDLGTHACYLIYGVLGPGDPPRTLKPGVGHEEIIMVVSGAMRVESDGQSQTLQAGQAIYLRGEETWLASAPGPLEARYVAAGGHSQDEHQHHHH